MREDADPGEDAGEDELLALLSSFRGLEAGVRREGWSIPMLEQVLARRLSGDSLLSWEDREDSQGGIRDNYSDYLNYMELRTFYIAVT